MKPILLTDLDDTLFQTARKMLPTALKQVAANDVKGQPLSFMYPWQAQFIEWALQSMLVLPVTARGIASFKRVKIPFQYGAICLQGAIILRHDYSLDQVWYALMQTQLESYQSRLPQLLADLLSLGQALGFAVRGWLEGVDDFHVYVVIKSVCADAEELAQLWRYAQTRLDWQGFYPHQNANNLALIPQCVTKQAAVAEWIRRHTEQYGRVPILGMGDSVTDWGFMQLCDFAAFPPHSQIAQHTGLTQEVVNP